MKPATEIPHIDTEKLQERLSRSFQEILSGFNRTKAVDAFEALGRAAGAEVPQEPEAQEENMEDYHVQDLEPEAVNEGIISADSGVAGVSRTEMDELEMMEKPKGGKTRRIKKSSVFRKWIWMHYLQRLRRPWRKKQARMPQKKLRKNRLWRK